MAKRKGSFKKKAKAAGKRIYKAARANQATTNLLIGGVVGFAAAKLLSK